MSKEGHHMQNDVVAAERKRESRRLFRCGYDVIQDHFFVEEDIFCKGGPGKDEESGWSHLPPVFFDDFNSYYNYLEGNIYENACYYLLDINKVPDNVDINKLYSKKAFVEHTISDYTIFMTDEEKVQYNNAEKRKGQIKKWIDKFNKCSTSLQLNETVRNYKKSTLSSFVEVSFFFWQYIFEDLNDESRFKNIMEYMSTGAFPSYKIIKALCAIYNPDSVAENYKYELGSYQTCRKHRFNH